MSGADHYEVLNVERTAGAAEIKAAYRKLALQVHPDQGGNAALFRLVQEAWNTLSDPAKRAAYDRSLDNRTTTPHPPRQSTEESVQPGEVGPVLIYPTFGHWRLPALVVLVGWTALAIGLFFSNGVHNVWDVALGVGVAGMIVLAAPPHWTRRLPLRGLLKVLGVLTAALYLLMMLFAKDVTALDRVATSSLVAGLVVVRVITGRWSKYHDLDVAIDRDASYEFNLWGRPGEPLIDDALSAPITPYDALLQRRTAKLLDPVLNALPAAKLVHGAQLGAMTVDHMLLNGHRAALIVSLMGPPGTYSLDSYGALQLNGQPLESPAQALEGAVQAWRGRLRQVDVRGFLVIHSDTGSVRTQLRPDAPVSCLAAQSAARELHTWLLPERSKLDRKVLYDVLRRAPYGLT
ncbi:MAG TPA: J domain-containing protein [Kribbella sp.]